MDITWVKNSTFLIKTAIGKRLIIDPFNKINNYNISEFNPNVITLSSPNIELPHSNQIDPHVKVISSPGIYNTDIGAKEIETFSYFFILFYISFPLTSIYQALGLSKLHLKR